RINEAGVSNMLAHARGADLDGLGANYGVTREDEESDERLRRRIHLAVEAFATAGTAGGYVFHALTSASSLADATAVNTAPGEVVVTVMGSEDDPSPSEDEVEAARARLFRDDIKPLTDILTVQPAEVIETSIEAEIVL